MELEGFANVWQALEDTPEQAANMEARSCLMMALVRIIRENGWTQTEAAEYCGVTQPCVNDLLRGRIDRFSLDALVNMSARLGRRVRLELEPA